MCLFKLGICESLFCVVMLAPALAGCAPTYSAKSITAQVVDADTKEPIEGVLVVGDWQLQGGGEGSGPLGALTLLETFTDSSGSFHFAAWGPKKAERGWLGDWDPALHLFKDGYEYTQVTNPFRGFPERKFGVDVRTSIYDGKVIQMRRFTGDLRQWNSQLEKVRFAAEEGITLGHCAWRRAPHFLQWLKRQSEMLRRAGLYNTGTYYDSLSQRELEESRLGCGSFSEFATANGMGETSGNEIAARVIDAKTGKPVEGTVVLAVWQLASERGTLGPMRPITGEAVTDGSGAFRIPAWGPIRATYWYPPALWLFKSGYSVLTLNSWNSTGHLVSSAAPSSKSHYNGETLELPPFEGTLEKYAEHLATNANQPEWLTQHCAWKGAPKFLSALAAESERFRLAGAKNVWPYDRTYYEKLDTYADVRSECGSIKQFVQEHGQ